MKQLLVRLRVNGRRGPFHLLKNLVSMKQFRFCMSKMLLKNHNITGSTLVNKLQAKKKQMTRVEALVIVE